MTIQTTLKRYIRFVDAGVSLNPDGSKERLMLGAMGLAGETGEVVDALKKHLFHDNELDMEALRLELGDVFWYFMLLLRTLNMSLDGVVDANIRKLTDRYPDRHMVRDTEQLSFEFEPVDEPVDEPVAKAPLDFNYDGF